MGPVERVAGPGSATLVAAPRRGALPGGRRPRDRASPARPASQRAPRGRLGRRLGRRRPRRRGRGHAGVRRRRRRGRGAQRDAARRPPEALRRDAPGPRLGLHRAHGRAAARRRRRRSLHGRRDVVRGAQLRLPADRLWQLDRPHPGATTARWPPSGSSPSPTPGRSWRRAAPPAWSTRPHARVAPGRWRGRRDGTDGHAPPCPAAAAVADRARARSPTSLAAAAAVLVGSVDRRRVLAGGTPARAAADHPRRHDAARHRPRPARAAARDPASGPRPRAARPARLVRRVESAGARRPAHAGSYGDDSLPALARGSPCAWMETRRQLRARRASARTAGTSSRPPDSASVSICWPAASTRRR